MARLSLFTFLPVSVEDLDVFELHTDAGSQGHRVRGIVFAPALDGAIGVSPGARKGMGANEPERKDTQEKQKQDTVLTCHSSR